MWCRGIRCDNAVWCSFIHIFQQCSLSRPVVFRHVHEGGAAHYKHNLLQGVCKVGNQDKREHFSYLLFLLLFSLPCNSDQRH